MDENTKKELKLVECALHQLGEHFETVQIFVSRFDGNEGTQAIARGHGNWFARYGQVKEWITKEDQNSRNSVPKEDE